MFSLSMVCNMEVCASGFWWPATALSSSWRPHQWETFAVQISVKDMGAHLNGWSGKGVHDVDQSLSNLP
jgi:hypothetical protein